MIIQKKNQKTKTKTSFRLLNSEIGNDQVKEIKSKEGN